jgi:peptide/nickel transport system permease protein
VACGRIGPFIESTDVAISEPPVGTDRGSKIVPHRRVFDLLHRAVQSTISTVLPRREFVLGLCIIIVIILFSFIGPLVWRQSPLQVNLSQALLPPTVRHPFGTDDLGRDILARTMAGGQLDLLVSLVVTVVGGAIGMGVGLVSAMSRGVVDVLIMRVLDALLAFPSLILALAVAVSLGPGTVSASIGITISIIPYYARLMRSEVLGVQSLPYVDAAVASGSGRLRLVRRHIVPHTWGTMLIQASSAVGYAVLTLAALGFVGLGVQEPTAEWGTMITNGLNYVLLGQWWLGVFPGLGLLALVAASSLVADGLSPNGSAVAAPVALGTAGQES